MSGIAKFAAVTSLALGSAVLMGCQSQNNPDSHAASGNKEGTIDAPTKQGAMPGINGGPDTSPATNNNHGNAGGSVYH